MERLLKKAVINMDERLPDSHALQSLSLADPCLTAISSISHRGQLSAGLLQKGSKQMHEEMPD